MKVGDVVEYAGEKVVIKSIYENGTYWVANLNMPYHGTISEIVKESAIKRLT